MPAKIKINYHFSIFFAFTQLFYADFVQNKHFDFKIFVTDRNAFRTVLGFITASYCYTAFKKRDNFGEDIKTNISGSIASGDKLVGVTGLESYARIVL